MPASTATTAATAFRGFRPDTIAFLRDLAAHNDPEHGKPWFDENRARYDEHWVGAAKAFVETAGEALREIAPEVRAEPRVNGSIFRINRDVRFSQDKTPYKDHLDLWFWEAATRKQAASGFFLRLTPDAVHIGVGSHGFDKERLAAFRDAVADAESGEALVDLDAALTKAGFPVRGEHYKRAPKGYESIDPDGPRGRLLRFNALSSGGEFPHPGTLGQKRFLNWCMTRWTRMAPLHRWLVDHVQ